MGADPTIPRGQHNYDYHHPVAEAGYAVNEVRTGCPWQLSVSTGLIAWLCAQAEQYLAHMSGQTVNETNNELVGGMLLFCLCCGARRLWRNHRRKAAAVRKPLPQ